MGVVRHSMIISMIQRQEKGAKRFRRDRTLSSKSSRSSRLERRGTLIGPPGTFYRFDRLPKELRFMIWEFSIEPQVIRVEWEYRPTGIVLGSTRSEEEAQPSTHGHQIEYKVPAIMITSRESRFIGMKHYTFCFKDYIRYQSVWFNFDLDTLHMEDEDALVEWCAQIPRSNKEPIVGFGEDKKPNDAYLFERRLKHLSFEDMPWYNLDRGLDHIMARLFGLKGLILPTIPYKDERWMFTLLIRHLQILDHVDAEMEEAEFEELDKDKSVWVIRLDERHMRAFGRGEIKVQWWTFANAKQAFEEVKETS